MPFTQTIPGSPITTASPASVDSPTLPRTPEINGSLLPSMDLPATEHVPMTGAQAAAAAAAAAKRKTSRRANTAERRATHNAVERQRRETLNGRFLDLAGLLPNLSQIRRPSKSAIVNSSIAHIHASRRHRMLASRELRLVKMEADALRREINQWRDRAGVPCMEEPVRSDGFALVLGGELEIEQDLLMLEQAGGYDGDDGFDDGEDGDYFGGAPMQQTPMMAHGGMSAPMSSHGGMMPSPGTDEHAMLLKQAVAAQGNPFAHAPPPTARPSLHVRTGAHPAQAMMASPMTGGYGSAAELGAYESHRLNPYGHPAHAAPHAVQYVHSPSGLLDAPQDAKWGGMPAHLALAHGGMQGGMFTPPDGERGYAGLVQQRMLAAQQQAQAGHMYGSPVDGDDGASVGSAPGSAHGGAGALQRRPRSGSAASGSVAGSYEAPGAMDFAGAQQRMRERAMSASTPGGWAGEQAMMKAGPVAMQGGGGMGMGMNAAFAMML